MNCAKCGHEMPENVAFCGQCGTPVQTPVIASSPSVVPTVTSTPRYVRNPRDTKWGVFFILLPIITLILTLVAWALFSFYISRIAPQYAPLNEDANGAKIVGVTQLSITTGESNSNVRQATAQIINVILGFVGILSVWMFVPCLILGITFLCKKELDPSEAYDTRSGQGSASVVPEEIKNWNWAAAGLPKIWGVSQSVWLCFLTMVPMVSMFWWVIMGIFGNEWAWRKRRWVSVEQFKMTQRRWAPWGIAMFVLQGLFMMFFFIVYLIVGLSKIGRSY